MSENMGLKIFEDSVHGTMTFHELLINFIDTREFQRLRNIKQLSVGYLVYPAASHNRFEHCLGVCWLAGKLMSKLKQNTEQEVWEHIFPDEHEFDLLKLAIQIAGLLHDLGHGPFSHTWELFLAACGKKWDHEETSCALIDGMLWRDEGNSKTDDNLTELGKKFKKEFKQVEKYVGFIKELIKGTKQPKDLKRAFMYQIVANKFNDIDVDKWDYFLRDAQHLGFQISFNYKRLMKLCRVEIKGGVSHITFRDIEHYSIQGMFRVRADLHIRAYQHRVNKCLEIMLIDAFKEADSNGFKVGGKIALTDAHNDRQQFLKLSDSLSETLLHSDGKCFEKCRNILERIVTRQLYECAGEWVLKVEQTADQKENNLPPSGLSSEKLRELEKALHSKYAITQVCINQGKYYDPIKNVHFYAKEGKVEDKNFITSPSIRMDLPFYKVFVFCRGEKLSKENRDRVAKKVEEFLKSEKYAFY